MATATKRTPTAQVTPLRGWLPLVMMPAAVMLFINRWPAWIFMWALAFTIYAGFKGLTYADSVAARDASARRVMGYLFFWPGMNAEAFFDNTRNVPRPTQSEWHWAIATCASGVLLMGAAIQAVDVWPPFIVGWLGMVAIVVTLHFGLFHLLSLTWRSIGVDAPPLMDAPLRSSSVSDFWGRRWNRAFRDLGHTYIFHPLHRRLGGELAMLAVFLFSGVVHDLVISLPARGGWGLPTMYFILQGLAIVLERSRISAKWNLRHGVRGRLFATAVIVLPAPMLFHVAFIERVVIPMLRAWGASG